MSNVDLMSKFDEIVKRFKKEFDQIVEDERAKMTQEIEAYKAEKLRMKAVVVSDDDIINLNVGGAKMTTKRSTLCQVKGSLFSSMFSGRWETSLARDEDGRIFFDFNPQHFVLILDYLRGKAIATSDNPVPLPKVPDDQVKSFNNLIEYLGLSEEIVLAPIAQDEIIPAPIAPPEKFNLHSTGVTLQEGGKVAVHDATEGHKYVLGDNMYHQGILRRKLKIESFQGNNWMLVGMVKGDVVPQSDNSYKWPGSYGWALGCNGRQGVWKEGLFTNDNTLKNLTKQVDTIELVLDCDAAKLSLHLPTGQQFHIDLPRAQTWKLHVNLYCANDKIRIMEA